MRLRETYRADRRETVKQQAKYSDLSLHAIWRAHPLRGEENVKKMRKPRKSK